MDLVLLAAGFATRLEPLTLNQPKHLLKVGDGFFVDPLIDQIRKTKDKFNRKVVITNGRYFDKFTEYFKNLNEGYEVYNDGVISKDNRIGAIGDLLNVIEQAELNDDLLVVAMDFIFKDFSFDDLIDFSKHLDSSATVIRQEEDLEEIKAGSCLSIDQNSQVTKFEEKPKKPFSNFYCAPYYLIKKEDLDSIRKLPKDLWDNCGQIVKAILDSSELYAFRNDNEYLHMTTLDDYNRIKAM
jgi:glucose-1-phosphate thymidylyltransferase